MTYLQAHLMLPLHLPVSKKKKALANFKTLDFTIKFALD